MRLDVKKTGKKILVWIASNRVSANRLLDEYLSFSLFLFVLCLRFTIAHYSTVMVNRYKKRRKETSAPHKLMLLHPLGVEIEVKKIKLDCKYLEFVSHSLYCLQRFQDKDSHIREVRREEDNETG